MSSMPLYKLASIDPLHPTGGRYKNANEPEVDGAALRGWVINATGTVNTLVDHVDRLDKVLNYVMVNHPEIIIEYQAIQELEK